MSTAIREVSCGDRMGLGWCEGGGDGVKRGRRLLFRENTGLTRGDGVQRTARSVPFGGEVTRGMDRGAQPKKNRDPGIRDCMV